jgi:pimeloyl-ACP methyl ester carboxylesterase
MELGSTAWTDEIGPTSNSFVSQRLRLHYLDWGNAGAPTLILLHGGRDHAHNWDWLARALRDEWHIICPDLRGHGDSAWSPDGVYSIPFYVSDLAQLIHQIADGPVTIVAHSLGGAISLRYAGLYPERVRRLAAIEGLGQLPQEMLAREALPIAERWREWIDERRALSARQPRRYASLEEAYARMREQNGFLSVEQARHLTIHGISRNEDGSYSWKFDNYVRSAPPIHVTEAEQHQLWHNIECPVWLVHGKDSWASHPGEDGSAAHFRNATITSYDNAGHWVHHDRFASFLEDLRTFL